MLNIKLIGYADIVRNRLRLDLDKKLCIQDFFREKFEHDLIKQKKLCDNLYKNHVSR